MKDRSFRGVVFRFYYGSFSIIISYHKEKSRISLNLQGLLTLSIFFLDSKAKIVVVSIGIDDAHTGSGLSFKLFRTG